jgi:hypothetical protein
MQTDSIERNVKGCELDLDSTGAGAVQQGKGWTLNIGMILCVSYTARSLLAIWATVSFWRTPLRGVLKGNGRMTFVETSDIGYVWRDVMSSSVPMWRPHLGRSASIWVSFELIPRETHKLENRAVVPVYVTKPHITLFNSVVWIILVTRRCERTKKGVLLVVHVSRPLYSIVLYCIVLYYAGFACASQI